MSGNNRALPEPVEPEVVYQSDDPPSGPFFLFLEVDDGRGGWENLTWGDYRSAMKSDIFQMSPGNEHNVIRIKDDPEGRQFIKRKALNYAKWTHLKTRVIRTQLLL